MKVNWSYPFIWGIDTKSVIKSLWLGWILITWAYWPEYPNFLFGYRVSIGFQPGL